MVVGRTYSSERRCFFETHRLSRTNATHHVCIVLDLSCSALMSNGKILFFKLFSWNLHNLLRKLLLESSRKLVTIALVFSQTSAEIGQTLCQCIELVDEEDIKVILNAFQNFAARMNRFIAKEELGVRSSQVVNTLIFRLGIVASLMCPSDCTRKIIVMGDSTCSLPFSVQEELLKIFYSFDISCSFVTLQSTVRNSFYDNFGFIIDEGVLRLIAFNTNGCVFNFQDEVNVEQSEAMDYENILDDLKENGHCLHLFHAEFNSFPKSSIGGFVRQRFAVVNFDETNLKEYVTVKLREGYQFFERSHNLMEVCPGENSFLLSLAVRGDCLLHLIITTDVEFCKMWNEVSKFSVSVYLEGPYTFVHEFFVRNGTCSHNDCSITSQNLASEYRMESYSKMMKILAALVNKTAEVKLQNDIKRFVKYISSENLPEPAVQGLQFFKQQFDSAGNKISVPNFYEGIDIYEHIGFWNFVYSLDLNCWQKVFNVNKFVYTMQPDLISEQLFLMSWSNVATKSRVVLKQIHEALRSCSTVVIQELFLYAQYVVDHEDKKKLVLIRVNPDIQTVYTHCLVVYVAFPLGLTQGSCNDYLQKFAECMSKVVVPGLGGESNSIYALKAFTKSIEKLCMRYDNCPEDFEELLPSKCEESDANVFQDKLSLNVFSTLGSFYHHKRWIWFLPSVSVSYQNDSQLSASSAPSESLNMYELLMNRVLETRIREGFSILYGNQGVVSLVKELPVSLKKTGIESNVLLQYICFKPRLCRTSKRVLLAVEAWIEHHEGDIECGSLFELEVFCTHRDLIQKLERKDFILFNEVLTFLMCYELTTNDDVDINDLKLPKPKLKKSSSENLDERSEGTVMFIDYNFDALRLLETSQLYTISWQSFESSAESGSHEKLNCQTDSYNSNELLLQSLHANLEKHVGRISFYLSRSGADKVINYLQGMKNGAFDWASKFANHGESDTFSGFFCETLVPDAPMKSVDDESDEQLEWAVYIFDDNRDKSLFFVMLPRSLNDLKRINGSTSENGKSKMFPDIPVLIFHCEFNNVHQFGASEPEAFVIDSTNIHKSLRPTTKPTVNEMLLRVQEVYNQSYVKVLYNNLLRNVTTDSVDIRGSVCSEQEFGKLSAIMDCSIYTDLRFNLTSLLCLNCRHLKNSWNGSEIGFVDSAPTSNSATSRSLSLGSINSSDFSRMQFDDLKYGKTRDQISEGRCSDSSISHQVIEKHFNCLMEKCYKPLKFSISESLLSQQEKLSNLFYWHDKEDLELNVKDSDVKFGEQEDMFDDLDTTFTSPGYGIDSLKEPLFLRLDCTIEINNALFCEVPVSSLPTCVNEILYRLHKQVENPGASEHDLLAASPPNMEYMEGSWIQRVGLPDNIESIQVCLCLKFQYLPPLSKFNLLMSADNSLTSQLMTANIADQDLDETSSIQILNSLPEFLPSQKEFLEDLEWYISDVVATCLHDSSTYHKNEERHSAMTLEQLKKHVRRYSKHKNSSVEKMELDFVKKHKDSYDLMVEEIQKFKWNACFVEKVAEGEKQTQKGFENAFSVFTETTNDWVSRHRSKKGFQQEVKNWVHDTCISPDSNATLALSDDDDDRANFKAEQDRGLQMKLPKMKEDTDHQQGGVTLDTNVTSPPISNFMNDFLHYMDKDNNGKSVDENSVSTEVNPDEKQHQRPTTFESGGTVAANSASDMYDLQICTKSRNQSGHSSFSKMTDYEADSSSCCENASVEGFEDVYGGEVAKRSQSHTCFNDFWLYFKLFRHVSTSGEEFVCRIYFHKSFETEQLPNVLESTFVKSVFEKLCFFVMACVKKVNQLILLEDFYTNEICSPILMNYSCDNSMDFSSVDWSKFAGTDAFVNWQPNEFQCDEIKRLIIPIHVRIQPERPKSGSLHVSEAVTSVFEKCGIKNAREPPRISLYKTKEGHVFYIKCSIEAGKEPPVKYSPFTRNQNYPHSSMGEYYYSVSQMGLNASASARSLVPPRPVASSKLYYHVSVSIFGVGEIDEFLSSGLQLQLGASLREKTLEQLWQYLSMAQHKLHNSDVEFLQPAESKPLSFYFAIPHEYCRNMFAVLCHLKKNLSFYAVEPKYWSTEDHEFHFKGPNGERCEEINCMLYTMPEKRSQVRFRERSLRNPSAAGIAMFQYKILCPAQESEFSFDTRHEPSFNKSLSAAEIVDVEQVTSDRFHLQFLLWETGRVNRQNLVNEVFASCVNQALGDVYAEKLLLSSAPMPINTGPNIGSQPFEVSEIDLNAASETNSDLKGDQNSRIAFYIQTVYPWLLECYERTKCRSLIIEKCKLNFRQRVSELFFSINFEKMKDYVWILFKNNNGKLCKLRDQGLTKALSSKEAGLDFPEMSLPPQCDQAEYYYIAYNVNDWNSRSRHASGNCEMSRSRHHRVHAPPQVLNCDVKRRGILIGEFRDRNFRSVAYNLSDVAQSVFSKFAEEANNINFDSRFLACVSRQKMGLYNHRCFTSKALLKLNDRMKENRLRLDNQKIPFDEILRKQPNFNINKTISGNMEKDREQVKSRKSLHRTVTSPVQRAIFENMRQLSQAVNYRKTKEAIRSCLKRFEDAVTEQKNDRLTLSREELQLIVSRSRSYHFVTTPIFFAPSWQKVKSARLHAESDTKLVKDKTRKISKVSKWYDERKDIIMRTFAERFDRIHLDIQPGAPVFLSSYQTSSSPYNSRQHNLLTSSMSSSSLLTRDDHLTFGRISTNSENINQDVLQFVNYMVRCVNYGGVALIKFGFYINEYDCFFCVQLNTFVFRKTKTANSFELFDDYYKKLDYFVENLHIHSFAHDYQLQMLWNYVSSKIDDNFCIESTSSSQPSEELEITFPEFELNENGNVVTFLKHFLGYHRCKAPAVSIKRIVSRPLKVSLGIPNEDNAASSVSTAISFYKYLIERKDHYNITCLKVPHIEGKEGPEHTTLITRMYDVIPKEDAAKYAPLKCMLLVAHENVKSKGSDGIEEDCCDVENNLNRPDSESSTSFNVKSGDVESILVIRYFLILLSCNELPDKYRAHIRSDEQRRKFSLRDIDRAQALNEIILEQESECTLQILKVMERVKKDFYRDNLLKKIMVHWDTAYSLACSRANESKKKHLSFSPPAGLFGPDFTDTIFDCCLTKMESAQLFDYFYPMSVMHFFRDAMNYMNYENASQSSNLDSSSFKSRNHSVERNKKDLFLRHLNDIIQQLSVEKMEDFVTALSRIAVVHILKHSSGRSDTAKHEAEVSRPLKSECIPSKKASNSSIYGSQKMRRRSSSNANTSSTNDLECALIFPKRPTLKEGEQCSTTTVPQFFAVLAKRGKLPESVRFKLPSTVNELSVGAESTNEPKLVVISTIPLRFVKPQQLFCDENISFIQKLYNFIIYFTYTN